MNYSLSFKNCLSSTVFFWSAPRHYLTADDLSLIFRKQKGFCVGMEVNGTTKWLEIPYKKNGDSAMGIFTLRSHTPVNVGRDKWKSLISGSFVNVRAFIINA